MEKRRDEWVVVAVEVTSTRAVFRDEFFHTVFHILSLHRRQRNTKKNEFFTSFLNPVANGGTDNERQQNGETLL